MPSADFCQLIDCCQERPAPRTNSYAMLSLIGVGGGLAPCPSALAALLSAGASGHLARGLWVVLLFSCGIALTLMLVAVLSRQAHTLLHSRFSRNTLGQRIPWLTAGIITCIGLISLGKLLFNLA